MLSAELCTWLLVIAGIAIGVAVGAGILLLLHAAYWRWVR